MCVLRVSGPYGKLNVSLLDVPLPFKEAGQSRKEREREESPNFYWATFNLTISRAHGDKVPLQIQDSSQFLSQNKKIIDRMRRLPGVESLCVDFMWDIPVTSHGQYNHFPSEFLALCGTLGINIVVTVYLVSEPLQQQT